jgi:hypothetical protein
MKYSGAEVARFLGLRHQRLTRRRIHRTWLLYSSICKLLEIYVPLFIEKKRGEKILYYNCLTPFSQMGDPIFPHDPIFPLCDPISPLYDPIFPMTPFFPRRFRKRLLYSMPRQPRLDGPVSDRGRPSLLQFPGNRSDVCNVSDKWAGRVGSKTTFVNF